MNTKLCVENLASATTERNLLDLFSAYGNVIRVSLLKDGDDKRQSGFGCVTMVTPEGARAALQALNGKAVGDCKLTVSETWPHKEQADCPAEAAPAAAPATFSSSAHNQT